MVCLLLILYDQGYMETEILRGYIQLQDIYCKTDAVVLLKYSPQNPNY